MSLVILFLFVAGYLFIILEQEVRLNKAGMALLTAAACWGTYIAVGSHVERVGQLIGYLAEVSELVFFVLGAMVIVELIDAHDGFTALTDRIRLKSKRSLLCVLALLAFFLSAILDNLADTILMLTLLRRLLPAGKERWLFGGVIVIAANAGGAWSPIGDVTTTMLWIGGQISTLGVIQGLFLPSVVSAAIPVAIASCFVKGRMDKQPVPKRDAHLGHSTRVLCLGIGCLIAVPFWKLMFGLPPFMGMLLGVAILWMASDRFHARYKKTGYLRVAEALGRVDTSVAFFFLGILLAVTSLDAVGLLRALAAFLDRLVGDVAGITGIFGVLSALGGNVPLTAAAARMYDLAQYPIDHQLWLLLAYVAGTGGSMLLIGSAAGVALMGIERVNFWWYLRHISGLALIGYLAGFGSYLGMQRLF
jgi:Na+/H+ antiporter NhaD/arsenite permease-like protein